MMKAKNISLRKATLMGLLGLAGSYATTVQAAQCEHVITSEWNTGFVAEIVITNDGDTTIEGWEVQWAYDDASMLSSWNAIISGANPYTASNLSWNGTLAPGSSATFGIQGSKAVQGSAAPSVEVTGDICSEAPPADSDNDGVIDEIDQCPDTPEGDEVDENGCTIIYDADGDGVEDAVDQCPETPAGDEVDEVGCTLLPDSDGDGVDDTVDQCPDTPEGDLVDAVGCTIPDDDNDGVPNTDDQCPDTPEGAFVDANGCEVEGMFRINSSGNLTRNGEVMPMNCVSWFGLEGQHEPKDAANNPNGAPMEMYIGNMWWANEGEGTGRTIESTMEEIKALGVNLIRVPIAPQTLDPTDPQGIGDIQSGGVLKNHESVQQLNSRQALTDFIKTADAYDLNVIIDIHSCSNYLGWRAGDLEATPPYVDADRQDYDYTREDYACGTDVGDGVTVHEYNEEIWKQNLAEIAGLPAELGVDNIVGIDIFNEPWNYTWPEWKALAESAYETISAVNNDILIVVEGIGSGKKDGTQVEHGSANFNPNWGENLYGFADAPLNIPKDRLILSPHTYGPSVFVQKHFLDQTQEGCAELEGDAAGAAGCNIVIDPDYLEQGWEEHFGYLRDQGYAILIGEFGGLMDWPLSAENYYRELWSHVPSTVDKEWQTALVDYMTSKNIEGCYWSLNPESADTGGLFEHAYDADSNPSGWGEWVEIDTEKLSLLEKLWFSLDSDGDGVGDTADQCPDTPEGDEVDAVGCTVLPDSDDDGVDDTIDQCPETPVGDLVDEVGCTIPDDDNDGVGNEDDQCPDTPEGAFVDATGCEVDGMFRIDSTGSLTRNGEVMPMNCVSWFGLEGQHEPKDAANNPNGAPMEMYIGNMWWANSGEGTGRTIESTMEEIKALGVNLIRVPIAPQTLDPTDPQGIGDIQSGGVLKNHESVQQLNSRQALTDFIKTADEYDLNVIIDIHSCSNYLGWRAGDLEATPPYVDADRQDYDYTREDYSCGTDVGDGVTVHEYNEEIWKQNLAEIAGLSAELGVDNIVGIDIFNEPWNYTWAEWKALAESAYETISAVNNDIVIVVEGIGSGKKDGTEVAHGSSLFNPNWGENLYGFANAPLDIPKNRLILSPHTYGPSVFVQKHFLDQTQEGCAELEGDAAGAAGCNIVIDPDYLAQGWEEHFGYLRDEGYAILIGEFGGLMDWPLSAENYYRELWSHVPSTVDKEWQTAFVNYMDSKNIEGCYWSLNPESADTGGLFEHAYDADSNPSGWGEWLEIDSEKLSLLETLWK